MNKKNHGKYIVLVDLDGTTFDNSALEHLVPKGNLKDPNAWTEFNQACNDFDLPINPIIYTVNALAQAGYEIMVLTARGRSAEVHTVRQITDAGMISHHLIMRPMDNGMSPADWKEYAAREIGPERIVLAIDDDPSVIERFTDMGIVCLQPATKCVSVRGNR